MSFVPLILSHLGAKSVRMSESITDPECENDFLKLDYDSDIEITWEQYFEAKHIVMNRRGLNILRRYRNKLLNDSDWMMTIDNIERINNIEEWKQYRQMLRDLPEQSIQYIWEGTNLDFSKMNIPSKPTIELKT